MFVLREVDLTQTSLQSSQAPSGLFPFILLSKRLHSLYVLRLFNDPLAMCLFYFGAWMLCKKNWRVGCIFYRSVFELQKLLRFLSPLLTWRFSLSRLQSSTRSQDEHLTLRSSSGCNPLQSRWNLKTNSWRSSNSLCPSKLSPLPSLSSILSDLPRLYSSRSSY